MKAGFSCVGAVLPAVAFRHNAVQCERRSGCRPRAAWGP